MASQVTALRRPEHRYDDPDAPFDRVRSRVRALAPTDGFASLACGSICVYRFDRPTSFRKSAAFGVTLGMVLGGTKRVRFGDRELTVGTPRMLVITQETAHESSVIDATPAEPYLGLSVRFSPERVAQALLTLAEAGVKGAPAEDVPAFVLDQDPRVVDAVDRLLATQSDPLEERVLAPLVADEILFRLLRSDAAAAVRAGVPRSADAERIVESMRFIREHHTEKLTVPRLAREAGMSPSHFAHRFVAVARTSPMRYAREVRLQEARTLLLAESARASEVAARVGFESAAHFTREFKRRFGTPPTLYRART